MPDLLYSMGWKSIKRAKRTCVGYFCFLPSTSYLIWTFLTSLKMETSLIWNIWCLRIYVWIQFCGKAEIDEYQFQLKVLHKYCCSKKAEGTFFLHIQLAKLRSFILLTFSKCCHGNVCNISSGVLIQNCLHHGITVFISPYSATHELYLDKQYTITFWISQ